MFCPKCGTELPDGAAFCPNCGNQMRKASQPAAANPPARKPRRGLKTWQLVLCIVLPLVIVGTVLGVMLGKAAFHTFRSMTVKDPYDPQSAATQQFARSSSELAVQGNSTGYGISNLIRWKDFGKNGVLTSLFGAISPDDEYCALGDPLNSSFALSVYAFCPQILSGKIQKICAASEDTNMDCVFTVVDKKLIDCSITDKSGTESSHIQVSYTYDPAGRLTNIDSTGSDGSSRSVTITYDASGKVSQVENYDSADDIYNFTRTPSYSPDGFIHNVTGDYSSYAITYRDGVPVRWAASGEHSDFIFRGKRLVQSKDYLFNQDSVGGKYLVTTTAFQY